MLLTNHQRINAKSFFIKAIRVPLAKGGRQSLGLPFGSQTRVASSARLVYLPVRIWPPTSTSCFSSSKVTRCPVWMAAMVMHSAMEWL